MFCVIYTLCSLCVRIIDTNRFRQIIPEGHGVWGPWRMDTFFVTTNKSFYRPTTCCPHLWWSLVLSYGSTGSTARKKKIILLLLLLLSIFILCKIRFITRAIPVCSFCPNKAVIKNCISKYNQFLVRTLKTNLCHSGCKPKYRLHISQSYCNIFEEKFTLPIARLRGNTINRFSLHVYISCRYVV